MEERLVPSTMSDIPFVAPAGPTAICLIWPSSSAGTIEPQPAQVSTLILALDLVFADAWDLWLA
jgi:hypothetical protein